MPIYKLCSSCNSRIQSGSQCSCKKKRHKEYDKYSRNSKITSFYKSSDWLRMRDKAIALCSGIDIYSYYILQRIEYGHTVHHIVPIREDWSKRLDVNNLIYLTESNHQTIHKLLEKQHDKIVSLLQGLVRRHQEAGRFG